MLQRCFMPFRRGICWSKQLWSLARAGVHMSCHLAALHGHCRPRAAGQQQLEASLAEASQLAVVASGLAIIHAYLEPMQRRGL
jgi:hypothetical protein